MKISFITDFSKSERRIVFLCWMSYVCIYLTRINMSIAIPAVTADLGISNLQIGMVVSGFFWAYAIGQLINGYLGDRLPPKYMIAISLLVTSLCNIAFSVSHNIVMMIIIWTINGFAQSMLWSPVVLVLSKWFEGKKLVTASFSMSYTTVFGYLISWSISTIIKEYLGWRMTFLSPGLFTLSFMICWSIMFKDIESLKRAHKPSDNSSSLKDGKFFIAVVLLVIACIAQGTIRESVNVWLPTMIEDVSGLSVTSTIMVLAIVPVINMAGVILSRFVMTKTRNKNYTSICIMYFIVACPIFAALFLNNISRIAVVAMCILLLGLMFAINPLYTSFAPLRFKRYGCVSTIAGLVDCSIYIGAALSGLLTGSLLNDGDWNNLILMWIVALAVAMAGAFSLRAYSERMTAGNEGED